ncbi:ferritin-like domain-containing protein [Jiella sp. M17.18]|uniref:ferritin-like domain-containing protein n=1 Tax=Jiella sp. M17.18 TaxID=3234247 RepID=UPI0034E0458D
MATTLSDSATSHFIVGLRDVHAVENQALALIDRQLDRLKSYPDLAERLRMHRGETETQIRRVEEILSSIGESHSGLKDAALSLSGNMAALGHVIAGDEVLKNSFANLAFENFEAASYIGLITMAEASPHAGTVSLLKESLAEEEAMATWVRDNIPKLTRRFLELDAGGETSSR